MSMNKSFRTEWQNEDELKDSEETKSLLVLFFRMIASVFIVVSLDLQLLFKEQSSSTQGILVTLAAFQDFLLSSSIHHAIHSKSKGISSSLPFFTSLLSHITLLSASFQNFSLMSNWDIFFANESTLEKAMQFLFSFWSNFLLRCVVDNLLVEKLQETWESLLLGGEVSVERQVHQIEGLQLIRLKNLWRREP